MVFKSLFRIVIAMLVLLFANPAFAWDPMDDGHAVSFIGDYEFFCFIDGEDVSGCMTPNQDWKASEILMTRAGYRKKGMATLKKLVQGRSHLCALYEDNQVVCQFREDRIKTTSLIGE